VFEQIRKRGVRGRLHRRGAGFPDDSMNNLKAKRAFAAAGRCAVAVDSDLARLRDRTSARSIIRPATAPIHVKRRAGLLNHLNGDPQRLGLEAFNPLSPTCRSE
jgi:hypothetical protein